MRRLALFFLLAFCLEPCFATTEFDGSTLTVANETLQVSGYTEVDSSSFDVSSPLELPVSHYCGSVTRTVTSRSLSLYQVSYSYRRYHVTGGGAGNVDAKSLAQSTIYSDMNNFHITTSARHYTCELLDGVL